MLSAPTSTAPAASSFSISGESRVAGGRSLLILEPARVEMPFISNRFFTAKGTPESGPAFFGVARARSSSTAVKALIAPSFSRIVASARITSSTLRPPFRSQFVFRRERDVVHHLRDLLDAPVILENRLYPLLRYVESDEARKAEQFLFFDHVFSRSR